ncbi:putative F-box protein At4g22180 [Aegilops tauschii subsp. strangulata]|uniref:putative F-box protein At4g22180 n=1 Tax=Aegilops tauschii subsp. strangulata TaxID=200361 RepID=UPI003CC88088
MSTQWSDLPDDLFHLIYSKVTVLRDRVRFATVCRPWRAAAIMARDAAPPAIPWLVFSPSYGDESSTRLAYRLEDGAVMRIPLPSEALNGKRVVGADDGGWVAACGDMQLIVMNLFSGVEVTLPANDTRTICLDMSSDMLWKVVFSKSPATSGCIMAAITPECGIALCRIGFP